MRQSIDKYFAVLELTHGASIKEARKAYKDLIKVWHPDRFHNDPELQKRAESKVKEINDAYDNIDRYFKANKEQKTQKKY